VKDAKNISKIFQTQSLSHRRITVNWHLKILAVFTLPHKYPKTKISKYFDGSAANQSACFNISFGSLAVSTGEFSIM